MDIFVRNLPAQATRKEVKGFFAAPLADCGIDLCHCEKFIGKAFANITVLDEHAAQRFLERYGDLHGAVAGTQGKSVLRWNGQLVRCHQSKFPPDEFSLRAVAFEASELARRTQEASRIGTVTQAISSDSAPTRFAIKDLRCGNWTYAEGRLAFSTECNVRHQGTVSFGSNEVIMVLAGENGDNIRLQIRYHDCSSIVLGEYADPVITFAMKNAPSIYRSSGSDAIAAALLSLAVGSPKPKASHIKKIRTAGINDEHTNVAGVCFVYRVSLLKSANIGQVRGLLDRIAKAASIASLSTQLSNRTIGMPATFTRLNYSLTDQKLYGSRPFGLLFQLERLARNGVLTPETVSALLPAMAKIHDTHGLDATLSALTRFYREVPFAGPDTDAKELSVTTLETHLTQLAAAYQQSRHNPENPFELAKRYAHIVLVHKIIVTPCGVYLHGPEPEPANRVLRRYSGHVDCFARVVFQDENGSPVRYDPQASNHEIYHDRFKGILDKGIIVAGRMFSFLGFSHSSLRSQSCWFMAPLFAQDTFKLPHHVLKELGDFAHIRVPAKCAARIGQNFTDTNATVDLHKANVGELPVVTSEGYDFSDGVGTISLKLLEKVWRVYGKDRVVKPTAVQIRFKGFKGMVSMDSRLEGHRLMLRENMKKFEAPTAWNLEICGAAFNPLPMVLNRQFIRIFEDLGIESAVFMDLQALAVDTLRERVQSALNTANFLDETSYTKATQISSLIRQLDRIGLDYRQDLFLYKAVEITLLTRIRDIKYRGRIPVEKGYTLYGIMDETGELREGEIFVCTEAPTEGGRRVLLNPRVVVTRSPALHPGDMQIVSAVDVSRGSPLEKLSNVVVFSQHGRRDLPSQLSGGDLDGDLYNVIFDPNLVPTKTCAAADYPRVSAKELDRPVTSKDMSDFFVNFMESDMLGLICNVHMHLADQHPTGTFHPDCIKLARMASTAVDFSKTGIPVDMRDSPKYNRCRPDFMAPSPRAVISAKGLLELVEAEQGEDAAFEGLDAERHGYRYYRSENALGKLYREIDEYQFLAKVQEQRHAAIATSNSKEGGVRRVLAYLKRETSRYGILYKHHGELAVSIRGSYEESTLDLLYYYEPSPHQPVSEHEAFAGTILGRQSGAQDKSLRELSKTMRERFEAVVEYTIMRIVKGDDHMHGVLDLDLLYDENVDREVEALPRAMACLEIAVEERGLVDRYLGELESFQYVAAAVCLREYERYRLTTLGSSTLPRVD